MNENLPTDNYRKLPSETYEEKINNLQRDNQKLKIKIIKGIFQSFLPILLFQGLLIVLAARTSGPRGVEVALLVGIFTVIALGINWNWLGRKT